MENETLFNEEEEPPGPSTGLVSVKNEVSELFLLNAENNQPSLTKQKSDRVLFPFKDSPRSRIFRTRNYPEITRLEWFDWHWQLRNAIRDVDTLSQIINLSDNERQAMMHHSGALPVSITPYYASLLNPDDPADRPVLGGRRHRADALVHGVALQLRVDPLLKRHHGQLEDLHGLDDPGRQAHLLFEPKLLRCLDPHCTEF